MQNALTRMRTSPLFGVGTTAALIVDIVRLPAGPAPIGPRYHFHVVAVGIGEVDAPAIVVVDFAGAASHRIGPVCKTLRADAADDGIEIGVVDQEGVVLRLDRSFSAGRRQS